MSEIKKVRSLLGMPFPEGDADLRQVNALAHLQEAVSETNAADEKLQQVFRDFRITPSAANYVLLQKELLTYQETKQALWEAREVVRRQQEEGR